MDENQFPQYISNKPCGKDLFDGKSQDKIADNIANQIKKGDKNTRLIGIDGEWGSGKSNVIGILEGKLEETHHVYIYDAWGHQEDLQRKSFLEELTGYLIERKLLKKKTQHKDLMGNLHECTWREKLTFLLSRKKETKTQNVPELNSSVLWFGLILVLTPIMTVISNYLGNSGEPLFESFLMKIGFALFFPVLGGIFWLVHTCYTKFTTGKWADLERIFYIYKGQELSFTTFETLSENEPSVVEFKRWMHDLSADLESGLVIVFDNMDRLPPENIKELWSSIHTFFAEGDAYENIWVILPFDRNHLRKSFGNANDVNDADQFINKTFSIIYRISPPILTDWKGFFRQMFKQAFGEDEKVQESTIISLFDVLKPRFTPRDIVAFINELVSLKHIWGESIPLKYLAIYAIQKDKLLEDPRREILSGGYLGAAKKYFPDTDELQKNIAALTFNVSLDKAHQVILHRELELALRNKRAIPLNDLAKHSHFIDVLEDVVNKSEFELIDAVKALAELDSSILGNENEISRLQGVWDDLCDKQLGTVIEEQVFTDTHRQLLRNTSSEKRKQLVCHLCQEISEVSNSEDKKFDGGLYYQALADLQDEIDESSISLNVESYLADKSVSPNIFVDYLKVAQDDYKRFKLHCDSNELDSFCSEVIPEDFIDPSCLLLLKKDERYSFERTKDKTSQVIKDNTVTADNFSHILETLKATSKDKPIESFSLEQLNTLLATVEEGADGYFDLVALRLKYGLEYNTLLTQLQQRTRIAQSDPLAGKLSETDDEIVEEVAKRIEFYTDYGDLLELVTVWAQPLLIAVVGKLTESSYGVSRLNILSVLKSYPEIKAALNLDSEIILGRLNAWSQEKLTAQNFADTVSIELLSDSLDGNNDLTKHVVHLAKEFVESGDSVDLAAEWGVDDSYYYSTLYTLMEAGKKRALPSEVFRAIKRILAEIAAAQRAIPEPDSRWQFFIDKADKNTIQPTIKNIRDSFITNANITAAIFLFFAPFFEKHGDLNSRSGDVARTILANVVTDDDCLEHIVLNADVYAQIIIDGKEDASDFKESLEGLLRQAPENQALVDFASKVGVKADVGDS